MKSHFNKLEERARLWGLKEAFSGGSSYSAPERPWFVNERVPELLRMQPGEFKVRRRKEPRGSDPGNVASGSERTFFVCPYCGRQMHWWKSEGRRVCHHCR